MGWLSTLKAWAVNRYAYSAYQMLTPQGITRPTNAEALVNEHFVGWPYICASRNAETIAGVPLKLYARGGTRSYYGRRALGIKQAKHIEQLTSKTVDDVEEITENHPLLELLDYVNDEMTRTELIEGTVTWQEITGDGYWFLEPGPLGVPQAIYPLMSQYVSVVRQEDGVLKGYLYGKDRNKRIALDAQDVIHFRYPNPKNADYGLSPLEATFGAAVLLESQAEYEQSLYDSGGVPQVGMLVKNGIGQEERKRLYAEWRQKFASQRKGDKFIIMEGDTEIKTFGLPPRDIGVQFTQKFNREQIAGAFGLPMTMLQLSEASKAGAQAGDYQYSKFTIQPKLRRIAEKLTEQLAGKYDTRLFLAFDDPVPEDVEMRLKETEVHITNEITTVNEERALLGMEPVPWGEKPKAPPPSPLTVAPGEDEEEEPSKTQKGLVEPLTAAERSFTKDMTGYLEKYRDKVIQNLEEL